MSCGVGCRCGWHPVLLWLWCKPATTAPILPLAWEPPYASGAALEKAKRQKKKKKRALTMYSPNVEKMSFPLCTLLDSLGYQVLCSIEPTMLFFKLVPQDVNRQC